MTTITPVRVSRASWRLLQLALLSSSFGALQCKPTGLENPGMLLLYPLDQPIFNYELRHDHTSNPSVHIYADNFVAEDAVIQIQLEDSEGRALPRPTMLPVRPLHESLTEKVAIGDDVPNGEYTVRIVVAARSSRASAPRVVFEQTTSLTVLGRVPMIEKEPVALHELPEPHQPIPSHAIGFCYQVVAQGMGLNQVSPTRSDVIEAAEWIRAHSTTIEKVEVSGFSCDLGQSNDREMIAAARASALCHDVLNHAREHFDDWHASEVDRVLESCTNTQSVADRPWFVHPLRYLRLEPSRAEHFRALNRRVSFRAHYDKRQKEIPCGTY